MTEDDLHHKLNNQDGRRLPTQYYPQQNTSRWDQPKREELRRAGKDPVPEGGNKGMLCYNCHQYGVINMAITNPNVPILPTATIVSCLVILPPSVLVQR